MEVETGINIDEIKKQSIHNDLFTVLCLLKKARDIMHEAKDSEELDDEQREALDDIQMGLNEDASNVNEIISDIMYSRIDNLI